MKTLRNALLLVLAFALIAAGTDFARAQTPCTDCSLVVTPAVEESEYNEWFTPPEGTVWVIIRQVAAEFAALQIWYAERPDGLFKAHWLPAFQQMTSQLSAVAMQQTMIFGAMLDAKHQLETQQLLQKLSAQAHKDYQPSVGLCEFGSSTKSLAASERKGEFNTLIMAKRSLDRQLGASGTAAATGASRDMSSRFEQFKKTFCDPNDDNGGLQGVCQTTSGTSPASSGTPPDSKTNKDIDYARTIDAPWTLNVDFSNSTIDNTDEPEIMALASNLYGHEVFSRKAVNPNDDTSKKEYMDLRAVWAKRSVAENSYNAIVGMKSAGTAGSKDYLKALMQDLGVNDQDATRMMGDNPSYYAQMEILTKKIYQSPDFYTNLYDTPVNVARKGVALQAINLMQKFDLFKSYLRNEASLSVLLELALIDIQSELENK